MAIEMNPTTFFINGEIVASSSQERTSVVNPATEEVIGSISEANELDVDRAVSAAHDALFSSEWGSLTPKDRGDLIRALGDAIDRRVDEIATLTTMQNGMPISNSRAAHGGLGDTYRYFASLADTLRTEERREVVGGHAIVQRNAVGVAAVITPFNAPQPMTAWKLGPALAAGCTAVVKPPPEVSLDACLLAEAIQEAGFPRGVINVVTGCGPAGEALVSHPKVSRVAFTGSVSAGLQIASAAASTLKRVTLELGGKSAGILLDDVDLREFAPFVTAACSPNSGQVCRGLTRVLAPKSRYDDVVEVVAEAMRVVEMGDPMSPTTVFGPLVSARQRDRVEMYLDIAQDDGAKLVVGGGRPSSLHRGFYIEPTVYRDVTNQMHIAREEIFGPVLVVIPYESEDEAIQIANDSDFGLGGGVFTSDTAHGLEIARRVQTGSIGINSCALPLQAPFGGIKLSGIGRELGPESVDTYLESKTIFGGTETQILA
jgi:aldehyde dehydrogenase (NAD+)